MRISHLTEAPDEFQSLQYRRWLRSVGKGHMPPVPIIFNDRCLMSRDGNFVDIIAPIIPSELVFDFRMNKTGISHGSRPWIYTRWRTDSPVNEIAAAVGVHADDLALAVPQGHRSMGDVDCTWTSKIMDQWLDDSVGPWATFICYPDRYRHSRWTWLRQNAGAAADPHEIYSLEWENTL